MKTVDYVKIESLYNTRLSIQENLEVLRQKGIEVSERTLYRYCKDKGIGDRLSDDELRHLIDPMQTVRQNLDILKGQGYRIGNKKVCKILKESSLSKIMNDKKQPTYELKEDNKDETGEGELMLSVSSNRPVKIKITGDNELSITLEDTDKTQTETTTINIYKN